MTEKTFDRAAHMRAIRSRGTEASARNRALGRLRVAIEDVRRTGGVPDAETAQAMHGLLGRVTR